MESVYLKTLVEVVRSGSLSRAAEVLFVTQPAVSRRIKFLETQYGYELLDRSGPVVQPTPAGRLVYQKAEALLKIESELAAGLLDLGGKTRISFAGTPSFGIAHLPAILREFMLACADNADLQFAFHAPEAILEGLEAGVYDVAVMELCECGDLSGYATHPLPGDELVFTSAPSLGVPSPLTPAGQLLGLPLFTRREGCCARIMLERNLASIGHTIGEFRKLVVIDDLHVLIQAVLDGEGVSFLSRDVLDAHLRAGRLLVHHVPGFQHHRDRALVINRPAPLPAPLVEFVSTVFRHFGLSLPASIPRPVAPERLRTA